ncbi:peptidoglycan DD-metalloendopeptidase family protein [Pseudomaricurvus sp. HS19]|uniref:peptidoglycan DD-metalloendopeptidase family protein n=1 Tax=Pseudomaricurvus sp. HS19 TaxID=2692626 RepID=UPI00136809BC|nr:peptidoglycan DD-metalloendopeptidase family protein [Pseudomaricurvus sp. HS19]MYM63261.1 peptidoglycan DD-metalloendopeptidase family protein [Pseudomaricurvus sp. HS19]
MTPNKKTQPPKRSTLLIRSFPRRHLRIAIALLACLGVTMMLIPSGPPVTKRHQEKLTLNLKPSSLKPGLQELLDKPVEPVTEDIVPPISWHKEEVRSGDSLSLIFQRAGLSDRALWEFMSGNPESSILKRIHPGHELQFHIADGQLQGLQYRRNRLESELFTRADATHFNHETKIRQPDVHRAYRQASIDDSLFLAGQRAGMDADLIMELANIFGWDIDFGLDIRKGDQFMVLYEEQFLDGEKIGNGAVLAAEFINQNHRFRAVRYEDPRGQVHYFTPDGKSMRKAFLRAPLDFRRISSNFNPKRLHPVFKTVKPHRGTDYAASRGTPVWAAGDGKVIASSFTKANGNYVVIQHGNNIQTKYLHLHKRTVKNGQRVKQRQQIGTVGNTGYSTAPHLHYEFLLNGVHRNPRTILDKLPKAQSVPDSEMEYFRNQTQPILASLDQHREQTLLASSGRATQ